MLEVPGDVAAVYAGGEDAFVQQMQRMLLAIADRAEDLVPASCDGEARLARVRFRHRDVRGRRLAFAGLPRGGIEQAARGIDVAHQIGARVLDRLVAADRSSALHPRLRVLDGQL